MTWLLVFVVCFGLVVYLCTLGSASVTFVL